MDVTVDSSISSPATGIRRKLHRYQEADTDLEEINEVEQRERMHAERALQQGQDYSSAGNTPVGDRRKSVTRVYTNAEIKEIYRTCLQMSAENKINIKNAFSLHLIDVISDLTNEKSRVNFEVAGTTIRAGVKIYSYRVDNVYQEAYRVASRLGIEPGKKGNQDKEEQRREGTASPECPVTKRKRPRKQLVGSTIEKNLANITTDAEDFNCDIDPLFEKFRNAFGAGSPAALFMNMLPTSSKSNQLLLCCADSQAAVDEEALLMRDQQLINSIESDPEISKVIDFVARNTYTTLAPSLALLQSENSDQTSQIEDEPLTLAADGQDYNYFNNVEKGELDDQMNENGSIDDEDECDVQKNGTVQKFATLDLIASAVSSKPLDYSYFEPAAMITLAGPNHWKVNYLRQLRTNQLKSKGGADDADIVPKKSKQQARRPLTRIDFDEQLDFGELLQVAKRSTITLSNTTLERYMQRDYTLDSDIDFDPNRFKYLFIKNIPMRKTAVVSENCVNGDQVTVYNYKNAVDNDNFCPDLLPDGENENDDAAEPFDLPSSSSSSPTIGHPEVKGVDEAKTDSEFDQQLLPQPFKVNKIEIAFEKCAKRIDVLQLKESMWKIINDGSIPHGELYFSTLCSKLCQRLSVSTLRNLSTATVFVCFLHICNEKNLTLEGNKQMSDFKINLSQR